jgi:AAA+ ATPase superfamily predicted ATPase
MNVTFGRRRIGKSTRLVRISSQKKWTIVCYNKEYINDIAEKLGLEIPEPITFVEFLSKTPQIKQTSEGISILIDDADALISMIARGKLCNVEEITISQEEVTNMF